VASEATIEVPEHVRAAARRGLQWRRDGHRGGTDAGVSSARRLASGTITPEHLITVAAWFARHGAQPRGRGFGDTLNPTPRRVSFALWGDSGDGRGAAWAARERARLEPRGEALTARAERAGRLPDGLAALLAPPQTLPGGEVVYEAVVALRDTLEFDGLRVHRGDEALAALARSGALEGLRLLRGPSHPPLTPEGRFAPAQGEEVGALLGARYDPDHGALIGRLRVWGHAAGLPTDRDGLSLGYMARERAATGDDERTHGADVVVEEIVPDHIILTDSPRGGASVALRLEATVPTLEIEGVAMDAAQIEELIETLKRDREAMRAEMDKMRAEMDAGKASEDEAMTEARAEAKALRARVEALERDRDASRLVALRAEAAALGVPGADKAADLTALCRAGLTHLGVDPGQFGAAELPAAWRALSEARRARPESAAPPASPAPAPAPRVAVNPFAPAPRA
jgi:hypothetical protein